MKYIVLEADYGDIKKRIPFIFPNELIHKEVTESMIHTLVFDANIKGSNLKSIKPVSAGFWCMYQKIAYGESETLKLKSDPNDTNLIVSYDYNHGVM